MSRSEEPPMSRNEKPPMSRSEESSMSALTPEGDIPIVVPGAPPAPPEPAAGPGSPPAFAATGAVPRTTLLAVGLRSNLLQAAWNFERQQGLGWAFALAPALAR